MQRVPDPTGQAVGGPRPRSQVLFCSWPQRISNALALVLLGFLALGAAVDTPVEPAGWVCLAAGLWFGLRATRLGVGFRDTQCVVRNILRTRKVSVHDIVSFDFGANPMTLYRNESMVLVLRSGRRVSITGLTLPVPRFLQARGRARCESMNAELEKRKVF